MAEYPFAWRRVVSDEGALSSVREHVARLYPIIREEYPGWESMSGEENHIVFWEVVSHA